MDLLEMLGRIAKDLTGEWEPDESAMEIELHCAVCDHSEPISWAECKRVTTADWPKHCGRAMTMLVSAKGEG